MAELQKKERENLASTSLLRIFCEQQQTMRPKESELERAAVKILQKKIFFSRVSYFAHQSVQGKLFMVHDALEKMSPILKMNGNLAALWFSDFLALHVSLFTCNYVKIAARVIILCLWLWK